MPPRSEDDLGSLERARKRLYQQQSAPAERPSLSNVGNDSLPHTWDTQPLETLAHPGKRHMHVARTFLVIAGGFFVLSLAAASFFFYSGGNSISLNKISIDLQGPTTIAAGDTVPLSLSITNRNPVPIENTTIEIDFPTGTLTADGTLKPYLRYTENLGTLASGATLTRSIQAIVFGGAGQILTLPISVSYGTSGSATDFVKKDSYPLAISSTPLSLSVDTLSETVSGKPLTFTLTVRSNATIPLENVVLTSVLPFGFSVTKSSLPMAGDNFVIGTLQPGTTKTVTLTGVLSGQDGEERVFHFTVGKLKSPTDQSSVAYMTQDVTVAITAPFLATTLSINGDSSPNVVVAPGSTQNVSVSYTNTLSTSVTNAVISIKLAGSAIDYDTIRTTNGFYRSSDRTIVFDRDADPSLANLTPGDSGIGTFTFRTVPSGALTTSSSITFTISVSGTRTGQTNVPEEVSATLVKTVKVATAVVLSASSLHSSGALGNSGPIPPLVDQATTYAVNWRVSNKGSAIADGVVTATLPSYITYTNKTAGQGAFSYDAKARTVSWNTGDLSQGATVQGSFQVSLTPSTSQAGNIPALTGTASFSGYDRFAGVRVTATADSVTTETTGDPGYTSSQATVQ